jgi:hypothetical protein
MGERAETKASGNGESYKKTFIHGTSLTSITPDNLGVWV